MTCGVSPSRLASVLLIWLAWCCGVALAGEAGGPGREPGPLARLAGPGGTDVAFSRDGRRVLTAGRDQARVWDAATSEPVTQPLKHGEGQEILLAALSPDGAKVLTAAGDEARLWDASTGKPPHVLKHGGGIRATSFSPDGARALTAGDDRFVRIWDPSTGKQLVARGHRGMVYTAEFAGGSMVLTVAGLAAGERPAFRVREPDGPQWRHADAEACLWDAATGRDVLGPEEVERVYDAGNPHLYRGDEPWFRPAAVSPDGTRYATFVLPDGLGVRDLRTGRGLAYVQADYTDGRTGTGAAGWVAFSPDGARVLTAGSLTSVRVFDAATGRPVFDSGWAADMAQFSPDGRLLLLTGLGGAVVVDVATGGQSLLLKRDRAGMPVPAAAFSPDGRRVAVGFAGDDFTGVWEVPDGAKGERKTGHSAYQFDAK